MGRTTDLTASPADRPAWGAAALSRAAAARLARVLAAAGLVLGAALPGLVRLELRTDGHALVPPDAPAVRFDAEVRERFGLWDPMVVVIESDHPQGIFNPETLRRIRDLSAALQALDWVGDDRVRSLATERRNRVYPETLRFRPFLDPLPETPEEIRTLRGDLNAVGLLDGTLVAEAARPLQSSRGPSGRWLCR